MNDFPHYRGYRIRATGQSGQLVPNILGAFAVEFQEPVLGRRFILVYQESIADAKRWIDERLAETEAEIIVGSPEAKYFHPAAASWDANGSPVED